MHRTHEDILDELLVLQAQDADRESLERLLRRWHDRLQARARALCADHDGAGDVLQEALVAIARELHRLDDPAAFPAWALRIVTLKSRDWIRARQRRRRREGSAPGQPDSGTAAPASSESDPGGIGANPCEGAPAWLSDAAALRHAVDALPPELRAVLMLHYAHDIPVDAIARSLGVPAGTVKSRLFHARRGVRHLLQPESRNERTPS